MNKRNGLRYNFLIVIGITVMALLLVGSTSAATITVPTNYAKIQWAIDNATSGDTIEVHSGTYYENVNVNKQLILHGIGMPVVNARGIGSEITLAADGIILEGFIIGGDLNNNNYGISVSGNNNTLNHNNVSSIMLMTNWGNTLTDNIVLDKSGIYLVYSDLNTLTNNNVITGIIDVHKSSNNTLKDNTILQGGIYVSSTYSTNILTGNQVLNGGIVLENAHNTIVKGNSVFNNSIGIRMGLWCENNTIIDNTISNSSASGIYLYRAYKNIIYNNYLNNNINFDNYKEEFPVNQADAIWNTTRKSGINIAGGPNLGGNFWANPNGTGYSQTCVDADKNGICDKPYVLDANNTDYLPLKFKPPMTSISFIDPTPADGSILARNFAYINTTISDSSTAFIDWNASLVGWWRFNNEIGETPTLFRDWSSWGNNATCSGTNCPASTSGKSGTALNFDGVNDYVDAGNGARLDITGAITIEAWINPAVAQEKCWDGVSGNYGVMNKVSAPVNSANWSWQLRYGAPGGGCYLGFAFNGNPEDSRWVTVKQNLAVGQWYHIVGTFDGTDIKSYLNGNLMDTNKISAIKGYRNRLLIGNDGWGNYFNGKIDEVRIHKRALSPEEIKASYDAGIFKLYRNFTALAGGTYNYKAYAQDPAGKVNQTEARNLIAGLEGDLNGNGQSADAGDLVLMKRASIGEIQVDSRYDLNNNGQNADAGDLVLMKRASIGEINLEGSGAFL